MAERGRDHLRRAEPAGASEQPDGRWDGDVRVEISAADLQALHERRLRRILDVAAENGGSSDFFKM